MEIESALVSFVPSFLLHVQSVHTTGDTHNKQRTFICARKRTPDAGWEKDLAQGAVPLAGFLI